jgi:hypothetical protein
MATSAGFDPDLSDWDLFYSGNNIQYIQAYSGTNVYKQSFVFDQSGNLTRVTAWTFVPSLERNADGLIVTRSTGAAA